MGRIGSKGYCIIHPAVVTVEGTYLANQTVQGITGALVVTVRGLKFTPNDPNISLGMDVDFAATKSHIMSKETPKMKKAFMKLCTDVEGSFISFEFQNFQEHDMWHGVVAHAHAKQKPSIPPGQQQLLPNHLPILSMRWIIDAF
jgi:hypothetical protein